MTLIELLVVIIIMTIIVAAAIPLMSPNNDDRRLREGARNLNTYITGAQSRAIALNRQCGVALKRLSHDTKRADDNGACLEVFYVEQQPPYAGFDANSRVCVSLHPNPPVTFGNPPVTITKPVLIRFVTRGATGNGLPSGWMPDLFPDGTVRPGDVIEINGTRFTLLADYNSNDGTHIAPGANGFFAPLGSNRPAVILAQPINDSGQQINPRYDNAGYSIGPDREPSPPAPKQPPSPFWTFPSPYKILRQPTPMADEPYQLPEGVAIDLRASGVGSGDYFYVPGSKGNDNIEGILIMFAPEGRVSRVSFSQEPHNSQPYDQAVVDNVFLLIGRRENIAPTDVTTDPTLQSSITSTMTDEDRAKLRLPLNWLGGSSRWIVIGSQTGRVATIGNEFVDLAAIYNTYTASPYSLNPRSEELRNQQILAARERTREMSQLEGR